MADGNGPQSGSQQPVALGRRKRSDAERNRAAVLAAARRLVADRGLDAVTMDDIARAAGVGKGTVYRAVRDKAGLAIALVDDAERSLQQRILDGPAPLGPGADARSRLAAFIEAYIDLLGDTAELLALADHSPVGGRYRTGAYAFWHTHVRTLLAEAGMAVDPQLGAHCVLAALAADLYLHVVRERRVPPRDWAREVVNSVLRGDSVNTR